MATADGLPHAVAGAAGGVVASFVTYPLQTISSRLSVQSNSAARNAYRNAPDALRKILATEGPAGLYSGLSSAVFGIAVTNGIYYFFYETTKRALEKSPGEPLSTLKSMLTGAVAGAITTVATNPIWVINTRMTVKKGAAAAAAAAAPTSPESSDDQKSKRNTAKRAPATSSAAATTTRTTESSSSLSSLETLMLTVREDGVLSLWQGIFPALILVSNPIIQYTVFEQLKQRVERWRRGSVPPKALTGFHFFLLGAVSKLCASVATYPYVLIKSRMQLRKSKDDTATTYDSVADAFRKIVASEGPAGLFKGLGSKLLQSTLAAAILFSAKEEFFKFAIWLLVTLRIRKKSVVAAGARG